MGDDIRTAFNVAKHELQMQTQILGTCEMYLKLNSDPDEALKLAIKHLTCIGQAEIVKKTIQIICQKHERFKDIRTDQIGTALVGYMIRSSASGILNDQQVK